MKLREIEPILADREITVWVDDSSLDFECIGDSDKYYSGNKELLSSFGEREIEGVTQTQGKRITLLLGNE